MVPGTGIEPVRPFGSRDFKSLVSTYFTTRAEGAIIPFSVPTFYLGAYFLCFLRLDGGNDYVCETPGPGIPIRL